MKIMITGSSGFIGRHLTKQLETEGHEIIGWDRKEGKDIHDFTLEPDTDFVIHLAADADVRRSIEFPNEYWNNNVTPTTKIQEICFSYCVPLIYASSSCIHQWHKSPYGITKKINEETAKPRQVAMRFTTVYGGDGAQRGMFMDKLKDGSLKYATDHIRDFVHIEDVIDAIKLIMLKLTDSHLFPNVQIKAAYDIGTGKGNVVSELARIKFPGVDHKYGDDCEAQNNTADITAIKELGFEAKVDVLEYLNS